MEKQRDIIVVLAIFGIIFAILAVVVIHGDGGCGCIKKAVNIINSIFGIPIFLWGIGGYIIIILYSCFFKAKRKIMIIIPLFLLAGITYVTSGAIGISFGIAFFCPFCIAAWTLNLIISLIMIYEARLFYKLPS